MLLRLVIDSHEELFAHLMRFYFSHMVSKDNNVRYPHVVSLALDEDNDKVGLALHFKA